MGGRQIVYQLQFMGSEIIILINRIINPHYIL